ncbi:MAG: hypothetical protein ABSA77_10715 [Thermoguttaceae bacterium]
MTLKEELHQEMIAAYEKAGKETGYWGRYFLRSVKKHGGLETAKRMLAKKLTNPSEQKGFSALIEAGRPDLSLERLVLQAKYKTLFTVDELSEAKTRLESIPSLAKRRTVPPERNYPDSVEDESLFTEGAKKTITVNAYERDTAARKACVKRHGSRCAVCDMSFEERYGIIGKGFIHIHHKKPLAGTRNTYKVNPTKDLIPVCPNCHAMLHTSNPPLGIEELKVIFYKMTLIPHPRNKRHVP